MADRDVGATGNPGGPVTPAPDRPHPGKNEETMCELLNRIWSRPRGEWTRVLRRELPALAAEIVEELLHGIPEFSALVDDNDAIDDDLLRLRVEEALLSALGYHDEGDRDPRCADPGPDPRPDPGPDRAQDPDPEPDDRHDGRVEEPRGAAGEYGREPAREHERTDAGQHAPGHQLRQVPAAPPDRARQDLFRALTDDRTACDGSLAELAEAARWPLPPAVRAVALATPGETQQLAAVLDDALAGMFAGRPCLLLPSPDPDARAALEVPLRGRFAAVGHAVAPRDTASSLRWALRLLTLTPHRAAWTPGPSSSTTTSRRSCCSGRTPSPRPGSPLAQAPRRPHAPPERTAGGHPARLAGGRRRPGGGQGPERAPADRALPDAPAGEALRARTARPPDPLRTGDGPAQPSADGPGPAPELAQRPQERTGGHRRLHPPGRRTDGPRQRTV
ncbi:LOW QUALITY PROTEIN: regulatory protein, partial [Streptomyces sp. C]